jgi:hypothetical protein
LDDCELSCGLRADFGRKPRRFLPPLGASRSLTRNLEALPKAEKCSSWQGFILGLPGDPDNTSTGTACASSADPMDLHVDFAITTVVEGGANVFFDHLSLPAPSLTGGDRDTSTLASGFVGSFPG